jgi:UrcA family protein
MNSSLPTSANGPSFRRFLFLRASVSVHTPHILREIEMDTKTSVINAKPFVCIAAAAACAMLSGPLQSREVTSREVTIKIPVNAAGLDLSQPADARELYRRIQRASRTACRHGDRVGLEPPTSFTGCYEKALGDAVRSVNRLPLTIAYLSTHTRSDAATHGIEVPTQVAAK